MWLYFRLALSFRDGEELLALRGIKVSYETIWCWTIKFEPLIAANLRRRLASPVNCPRPPPNLAAVDLNGPRHDRCVPFVRKGEGEAA